MKPHEVTQEVGERYKTAALQTEAELVAFCELLARENVKSYLEIGSKFGGSLWRVGQVLPKGSRLVSIDTCQNGPDLQNAVNDLNATGYDAWLIPLNSTLPEAIARAQALGPYDAVFIDGDHLLPGVTADWTNYGPMGRIVAFHDITWKRPPGWAGKIIDVPKLWDNIKTGYRFEEIKLEKKGKDNGIGVLWRS